ncbi:amidohydrolase family protein [Prosthecomicrobium pneumaticum]|uniref:5-methylthioadenosine/S-adenosylhomocysteine deaminase n=1 Tax=Prosthecomicrobium pneumaticum TaxID=81895 RepID=A0A7W9CUL4_9HYPH|nr:amidohydrolase family protein [Prosthecomicrobium pneumaticum]MBB5751848.1 5-methylthioadenosine/S-adenosylhomocysteine deaminase [Prosthecomicrobium pneumaticum]
MSILIRQGHIVTNDAAGTIHERGDVLIVGDRIAAVGADLSREAAAHPDLEVIEAGNRIVMPGFVDAHMHSNEGFEMGRYDNLPLEIWLSEVYPPFHRSGLSKRAKYLRALLVGIVSIRSGVTTLQDDVINLAFTPDMVDATASAYRDLGLRGWITASMWDEKFCDSLPYLRRSMPADLVAALDALPLPGRADQIALFEELRALWHGRDNMRIILGPCGPQRCSAALLEEVAALSESLDLPIHCHVLETKTQAVTGAEKYGRTLVQYLKDVGCMTHRLTMNHAIWLSERDIAIMGEAGCSITHNPLANLKLGSGVAPVRLLKRAGVNVALGCDGVASADTADMFQAFKAAAMLHKIGTHDYREWVSAHDVMEMATRAGARSSLMEKEVGALEAGMQADVILLDRYEWGFIPLHDPVQQIAFSAASEAVRTSIIAGRVVMRERRLTLADEDAVRAEIVEAAEAFRRDECPAMSRHAATVRPWLDAMHATATGQTVDAGHLPLRMPPAAAKARALAG